MTNGCTSHGYLNVIKPPGMTSHDVVGWIRRRTSHRRVGHTGTLDPAATGVLPIALGDATKTVAAEAWDVKAYWADIRFGEASDTDDGEGSVIRSGDPSHITARLAAQALSRFLGTSVQQPPAYSAVHVDGKRAYTMARRQKGQRDAAPALPRARQVQIDAVTVLGWSAPMLSLVIQCHSGTYVRSLARDLGDVLGCPSHLGALVRLSVGPFSIGDAISLETLEEVGSDSWNHLIWPADIAAQERDALIVPEARSTDMVNGRAWQRFPKIGAVTTLDAATVNSADERAGLTMRQARVYADGGGFLGFAEERIGDSWQPTKRLRAG
ncbi:MAG: truB [Chloroflexi bacterium]|nr:truB [Chloroflexota bacterium]